jgi:hypothetical protein
VGVVTAPWWAAFPPVVAKVECDGKHRLKWQDGSLVAVDHPDAESELVLAALGGDQPECVSLIRAWGEHSDNLDVLYLGPRSAKDELVWPSQDPGWRGRRLIGAGGAFSMRSSGGVFSSKTRYGARWAGSPPGHPDLDRQYELLKLFALGRDFQFRLVATVAAGAPEGPALTAALAGRLAPAVKSWLGIEPERVKTALHLGEGWGELEFAGSGALRAALPARWLAGVWAPGLAVIGRKLVVEVAAVTWPNAELIAVRRPGAEPESIRAVFRNGQWGLRRG